MQLRIFLAFLALSLFAHASLYSTGRRHQSVNREHSQLARRVVAENDSVTSLKRRCKPRGDPSTSTSLATTHSVKPTAKPKATSTSVHHTTSSSAPKPASSGSANGSTKSPLSGLLQATSSCGPSGATKEITSDSGPNGNERFLNCGIDGSGWQPAHVTVDQLIVVDLDEAIKDPNTPFKSCTPYIPLFKKYGEAFDIPAILLASIAMQESSCNPNAVGGAHEQGLMQITKDKCGGAPGGNCQDPDFNIKTGASFFATTLENNNGNVLSTLGHYNGWSPKMTIAQATAAAHTSCCKCQNNLDYLAQTLNGWVQNIDPSVKKIGLYHNLANC